MRTIKPKLVVNNGVPLVTVQTCGIPLLVVAIDALPLVFLGRSRIAYLKVMDAIDWYERELLRATNEKERATITANKTALEAFQM